MNTSPMNLSSGAAAPKPSGAAFICARAVRKTYRTGERPVEALRGANLEIREPGFYGIMGSSGSGKSTLLRQMIGLVRPAAGTVLYDGMDYWAASHEQQVQRQRGFGILFQAGALSIQVA